MACNSAWLMTTRMAGEPAWLWPMIDSNGFTSNDGSWSMAWIWYLDYYSSLGIARPFRNRQIIIASQRGHFPIIYTSDFQPMITSCRWRCFKPACRALLQRPRQRITTDGCRNWWFLRGTGVAFAPEWSGFRGECGPCFCVAGAMVSEPQKDLFHLRKSFERVLLEAQCRKRCGC